MRRVFRPAMLLVLVLAGTAAYGQTSRTAAELTRRGATELQTGNSARAGTLFRQALKIDPSNPDAHTYLGIIADQNKNLHLAEKHFAAAVQAEPSSASAHNNYGAVLMKVGRRQQAIAEFEMSLRLDPQQVGTLMNLGQAYFAGGSKADLLKAHDAFSRAEKLSPDPASARALLVTSIRLKSLDSVRQEYRAYAVVIARSSELSAAAKRLEIGRSLLELGLYDEAEQELKADLALTPDDPSALSTLAKTYRLQGRLIDGGKLLEGAVARGIESGAVYEELAEIYDATGHVENAIPAMRRAIAADPNNKYYHLRYGLMLNDTQAPAAAVVRLQEAVKMFPSSAAMQFALGLAYYADHKNQNAADCFDKAVALDSKFTPAYAYRGLVYADAGNYTDAIAQYEKSLALDGSVTVVHELLGEAILRGSNPDRARAEKEFRRAIELDDKYVPARLELAKLLEREGNPKEAAEQLERVLAINPKLPEPHYLLGRAYTALKRPDDSKREFNLFKQLDSASKQAEVDARNDLLKRLANVRY